jgi:recombination associated protein RdgC
MFFKNLTAFKITDINKDENHEADLLLMSDIFAELINSMEKWNNE